MQPPGERHPRTVRKALAVGLLGGVLGTTTALGAARAEASPLDPLSCGRPDSPDFPLASRVYGGPAAYRAGGDWRTWRLELRNTTGAACEDIHPVVVLAAARHGLRPERIRLEYRDPAGGDWRPVPFEATDRDEQIGVFAKRGADGARGGLSVPANGTVTVPVRLRFAPDTAPDRITATVTTVQRRGSDGEWAGQSGGYRFAVQEADSAPASPEALPRTRPETSPDAFPGTSAPPAPAAPPELAATAQGPARALALLAAGLFTGGALLRAGARRLRR
ncbi:hypothetical protein [Streptomyces chattanoogensis]|uniref:hypothetical protein n=1 Tax=Streptomyces chattanoogensis TaxID=66876 RepID=UPI0036A2C887